MRKKKKRKCHENDEGETTRLNRIAEKIAFVPSTDEHDVDLAEVTLLSSDKTSAASVSYIKDTEASDEKTSAASVSKRKHRKASVSTSAASSSTSATVAPQWPAPNQDWVDQVTHM